MDAISIVAVPLAAAVIGAAVATISARARFAVERRSLRLDVQRLEQSMLLETERRARAEQQADRATGLEQRNEELQVAAREIASELAAEQARSAASHEQHAKERELIAQMTTQLQHTFQALSAQALESNNEQFMQLAKSTFETFQTTAAGDLTKRQSEIALLVKPMQETLKNVERQFGEIERNRVSAHASLVQQLQSLEGTASTLATALRSPKARGRWGEMQLRRVVELAGMMEHCDFREQASTTSETGRLQPDLVVDLVGGKHIVVDAKTPMDSYLKAVEATDESVRIDHMRDHAARVRAHVVELSRKEYWKQFDRTPEFVVLFLPGEDLFGAALDHEPDLISFASSKGVVIATPTTLIATMWSVAHGWREQALADNALQIRDLGRLMYERAAKVAEEWDRVGTHLDRAVTSYNQSVTSMESRFLVTARKMVALEIHSDRAMPELEGIDSTPRQVAAPELVAALSVDEPQSFIAHVEDI